MVEDAALMLTVLARPHPRDPFSLPHPDIDYVAATRRSIQRPRVAYSTSLGVLPGNVRASAGVAAAGDWWPPHAGAPLTCANGSSVVIARGAAAIWGA